MKNRTDFNGIFVPRTVSVGKFRRRDKNGMVFAGCGGETGGIVSCRYLNDSWLYVSIFERLTGYKPNIQRDPAIQLKKTVLDTVDEFENKPTDGFRIVGWNENVYASVSKMYDQSGDVVIFDPRGFAIGFKPEEFFTILNQTNANIVNGVLAGRFVYGFRPVQDGSIIWTLISEGPDYSYYLAESEKYYNKSKDQMVIQSQLEYGHVYRSYFGAMKGDYVYLGIRDTYSERCHYDAFINGKYDFQYFCKKDQRYMRGNTRKTHFPTSSGKYVFYCLTTDGKMPYCVRSAVNGIFSSEIDYPDGAGLPNMYNDVAMKATLKNIEKDMTVSPCFNRISLSDSYDTRPMRKDIFKRICECKWHWYNKNIGPYAFPFCDMTYGNILIANNGVFKITAYNIWRDKKECSWLIQDLTKMQGRAPLNSYLIKQCETRVDYVDSDYIFFLYSPLTYVLKYENGNAVPDEFSALMKQKTVVDMIGNW